jgi:hypothetical protein
MLFCAIFSMDKSTELDVCVSNWNIGIGFSLQHHIALLVIHYVVTNP